MAQINYLWCEGYISLDSTNIKKGCKGDIGLPGSSASESAMQET